MRKIIAVAIFALAMLFLFSAPSEESDAIDTHTFTGDTVLEEDMVFEDGSNIVILTGASIDVATYKLDFGNNSTVAFIGSIELKSSGGQFVFGENTKILFTNSIVPTPEFRTTYEFTGTVKIKSSDLGTHVTISYEPSGTDELLYLYWEDSVLSVKEPTLDYKVHLRGVDLKIGAASFSYEVTKYDGGKVASKKITELLPEVPGQLAEVSLNRDDLTVTISPVNTIVNTTEYPQTGVKDVMTLSNIGSTTITSESGKAHAEIRINNILIEKYDDSVKQSEDKFTNVNGVMDADLTVILNILMPGLGKDISGLDIITYAKVTADHAILWNERFEEPRDFTDVVFTFNPSSGSNYEITLTANEGSDAYELRVADIEFKSFSMTKDLVVSVSLNIAKVEGKKTTPETVLPSTLLITNITLETSDLDLASLYSAYSRTGQITLQQLIDNSHRFYLSVDEATLDNGHDGASETRISGIEGLLVKDGRGLNTLTLGFKSLVTPVEYAEKFYYVTVNATELYMESEGSLTECLNALTEKFDFSSDAHAEIQLSNSGFRIESIDTVDSTVIECGRSSTSSPTSTSLVMSIDYSTYLDQTTINGRFSSVGYYLTFEQNKHYEKPEGSMYLKLKAIDASISFTFAVGEEITFSTNFSMPWTLDYDYYGIAFQVDGTDLLLQTSRGKIDVEGFDRNEQGLKQLFQDIQENDFNISTRVMGSSSSITVYKDDRTTKYGVYSDIELDIRNLGVDMKREQMLLISMDKLSMSAMLPDGSYHDRLIEHLDIKKDLSGNVPEESLLHQVAPYLAAVFAIISAGLSVFLIYLRIKRPELFKFTES